MTAIPLGKISVPSAGTPVAITLTTAQAAQLSTGGLCAKVEFQPDTGNTGTVTVKQGGVAIAPLPKPANGYVASWSTPECDGNRINPLTFALDAATNGDGAFVTLWVE